jgi:NTE family protein
VNIREASRIGIALSGGGAKSFAHLGVLKALEEMALHPFAISGTSAGAIIGAFCAHGRSVDEIRAIFESAGYTNLFKPYSRWLGMVRLQKLLVNVISTLPDTFEELHHPLTVAATDFDKGCVRYFSNGDLKQALLASCSLPILMKPQLIDGVTYVDGGLVDNLPGEPLKSACDYLIGLHCNPVPSKVRKGIHGTMERFMLITIGSASMNQSSCFDWLLEPPEAGDFGAFDFHKSAELYEAGYRYGVRQIEQKLK